MKRKAAVSRRELEKDIKGKMTSCTQTTEARTFADTYVQTDVALPEHAVVQWQCTIIESTLPTESPPECVTPPSRVEVGHLVNVLGDDIDWGNKEAIDEMEAQQRRMADGLSEEEISPSKLSAASPARTNQSIFDFEELDAAEDADADAPPVPSDRAVQAQT